jgi:hypothetical protein
MSGTHTPESLILTALTVNDTLKTSQLEEMFGHGLKRDAIPRACQMLASRGDISPIFNGTEWEYYISK